MHHTTEMRQEKIADIRAQLEEQLTKMDNFIFRVGSRKCTIRALLLFNLQSLRKLFPVVMVTFSKDYEKSDILAF